jgi:uncharacterized protein YkwD
MKIRNLFLAKSVFTLMFLTLAVISFTSKAFAQSSIFSQLSSLNRKNHTIETDERRVFDLVNREREKNNLSRLEWNPTLAVLARNYSKQMADERFFGHHDRSGASVEVRAERMKIKGWDKIGENLFKVSGTTNFTASAVQRWMQSPSHRRNILDPEWTISGIGVAASANGEIYVTQVFIRN